MARRYPKKSSGYAPPIVPPAEFYDDQPAPKRFFGDAYGYPGGGDRFAEYYEPSSRGASAHYNGRNAYEASLIDSYQQDPYGDFQRGEDHFGAYGVARRSLPSQEMKFSGHEGWRDQHYQTTPNPYMGQGRAGGPPMTGRKRMAPYVDQMHPSMARISMSEMPRDHAPTASRLYQLFKLSPTNRKSLWIGTMNAKKHIYYYNAVTLEVRFMRPPGDKANVYPQATLQNLLDKFQPATLVIKNVFPGLTENALKQHFGTFGKVHFAKVQTEFSNNRPPYAFIRMEKMQGQEKVLKHDKAHIISCGFFSKEVIVEAPQHRLFVTRIPPDVKSSDLLHFFSNRAKQIYENAYVIDVYRPIPFQQFAFVVFGDAGNMEEHFGKLSDLIFDNTPISCVSFPCSQKMDTEKAIEGISEMPDGREIEESPMEEIRKSYAEEDIATLFGQKLAELATEKVMASKLRSLESIAEEVKFLMQCMIREQGNEKSPNDFMVEMNAEFLKCSEDKIRNYLAVQEHVYDLCREILEGSIGFEEQGTNGSTKVEKFAGSLQNVDQKNTE